MAYAGVLVLLTLVPSALAAATPTTQLADRHARDLDIDNPGVPCIRVYNGERLAAAWGAVSAELFPVVHQSMDPNIPCYFSGIVRFENATYDPCCTYRYTAWGLTEPF